MAELAPERLSAFYEAVIASSSDDEQLGDVADAFWRQGFKERAIELWNRARRIDPPDEAWTRKLQATYAGVDPF